MRPVATPQFAHAPPAGFVKVGLSADLPSLEGRAVTVAGRRIAVFRTECGLRAVDAGCPHMGGPLGDGLVAGDCVTCPLHGLRIDLETGAALGGGSGQVAVHEVLELDGELWLRPAAEPAVPRAA